MKYYFILTICILAGCANKDVKTADQKDEIYSAVIDFSFDEKVYSKTLFGEPPQIAIWCEAIEDSSIKKNVYVSHRAYYNDWKGKVECDIALPYWKSRMGNIKRSKVDAVSSATPKVNKKRIEFSLSKKFTWNYFVEVNVSADYNEYYKYWTDEGYPDSEGNGQPSIIYSGKIISNLEYDSFPLIWACTDQLNPKSNLNFDLSKITSAKKLLKYFNLSIR